MKVLLQGYVSNNFGDDLFFEYIANRYPNTSFFLKGNNCYKETFRDFQNIKMLTPSLWKRVQNKILVKFLKTYIDVYKIPKDIKFSLTVGGSIFMQNELWKSETKNFKLHSADYTTNIILGCNFGPYNSVEYINEYRELFKDLDDICFRDIYSYNLFRDNLNTRYAPDIIFGLPVDKKVREEKKVFISVIKPSIRKNLEKNDGSYYKGISEICENYIRQGYKVSLVSFCKKEGDEEAINAIFELLLKEKQHRIHTLFYNGINKSELLSELASSEIIVATRFHAMILGWLYEKKVLPIIYSDKTLNVIQDLNFEGEFIDLRELKANYKINKVAKLENLDKIKSASLEHFTVLDSYLN